MKGGVESLKLCLGGWVGLSGLGVLGGLTRVRSLLLT